MEEATGVPSSRTGRTGVIGTIDWVDDHIEFIIMDAEGDDAWISVPEDEAYLLDLWE